MLSFVFCLPLVWLVVWNFFLVYVNFHSIVWLIHLLLPCCHILYVNLCKIFTTLHSRVISWWIYFCNSFCVHLLTFVIKYWLWWIYIWCPWIQFNPCRTVLAHGLIRYYLVLKVNLVHWWYKACVTHRQLNLLTLFGRCLMVTFLVIWLILSILKCAFSMKIFVLFRDYIIIPILYIHLLHYQALLTSFELCLLVRYGLVDKISTCVQRN